MQFVEISGRGVAVIPPDFTSHLKKACDVAIEYFTATQERWQRLIQLIQEFVDNIPVYFPDFLKDENLPLWRQKEYRIEIRKLSPTARRFKRNIWRWIRGNLWSGERKREV